MSDIPNKDNKEEIIVEEVEFEKIETPPEDNSNETIAISALDFDNALSQVINLSDANTYHEPTCPICSSPNRKKVEDKWLETKSYKDVQEVLKNSKVKISDDLIDNHIKNHYDKGMRELQKVEYINRLNRIGANNNSSTLERINFGLSVIAERLVEVNAITPSGDVSSVQVEQIKTSETKKLMDSYAKFIKMQNDLMGEMKNAGEMINIPKAKFINFFNESLLNAKNEEEQSIIKRILTDLGQLGQED